MTDAAALRALLLAAVEALEGLNAAFRGLKIDVPADRIDAVMVASQAAHAVTARARSALAEDA